MFVEPAKADTVVMAWQKGVAAVSLTHDDGRIDHIDIAAPALTARGLKGTFNVVPGGYFWTHGGEEQFQLIAQDGHELASHTMYHQGCIIKSPEEDPNNIYFHSLEELIQDCIDVKAILEPLQGRPVVSFTYPRGESESETRQVIQTYFLSARVSSGGAHVNPSSPPNMVYLYPCYVGAGFDTTWADYDYAYGQLTAFMNLALSSRGWIIEEYHDIDYPGYSALNIDAYYDHLDDLASNVQSEQLWVAPQGDVARYIYSRDSAVVTLLSNDGNSMELMVDDNLSDETFDVPLTLRTAIPDVWETNVAIYHNDELVDHDFLYENEQTFVFYSVLADGGLIQILPKPTLITPNAGEYLAAGGAYNIRWEPITWAGIVDVKLEYSTDNGESWSTIDTIPNTGIYQWIVPNVESEECLLRVSDADASNINDATNGVFTIYECQLSSAADLNKDCYVDFADFAYLAMNWLSCGNPYDEGCSE